MAALLQEHSRCSQASLDSAHRAREEQIGGSHFQSQEVMPTPKLVPTSPDKPEPSGRCVPLIPVSPSLESGALPSFPLTPPSRPSLWLHFPHVAPWPLHPLGSPVISCLCYVSGLPTSLSTRSPSLFSLSSQDNPSKTQVRPCRVCHSDPPTTSASALEAGVPAPTGPNDLLDVVSFLPPHPVPSHWPAAQTHQVHRASGPLCAPGSCRLLAAHLGLPSLAILSGSPVPGRHPSRPCPLYAFPWPHLPPQLLSLSKILHHLLLIFSGSDTRRNFQKVRHPQHLDDHLAHGWHSAHYLLNECVNE